MKNIKGITLVLCGMAMSLNAYSQCRSDGDDLGRPFLAIETECAKANSEPSYLSDGKDYRSLLTNNSTDFVVVFYADNLYRISACTDVGGPLSFVVKDHKNNVLFSNKEYENAPYWDLDFPTTIECIITISLPDETYALAFGDAPAADGTSADSAATEDASDEGSDNKPKAKVKPVCAVLIIGYKQE